jgi:diadenosine tetraphosphate (Ap4A) HIT family hydrolase
MFELDLQLQQDCRPVGRFPLCHVLLMLDANYPWFILVPARSGVTEIFELEPSDQLQLARESASLAGAIARGFDAHKINIAALGNVVPQLHIHHIVRYRDDPAWPAPVWGRVPARPYSDAALAGVLSVLRRHGPVGCDLDV